MFFPEGHIQQAIALLEPIYEAQLASIRQSRVKAMDETPIKAGQSGNGKMKSGYFWPVYGELDEIVFPSVLPGQRITLRRFWGVRRQLLCRRAQQPLLRCC